MIRYLIYLPLQLICMVLCYLTNWVVVLFASEEGELPGLLPCLLALRSENNSLQRKSNET